MLQHENILFKRFGIFYVYNNITSCTTLLHYICYCLFMQSFASNKHGLNTNVLPFLIELSMSSCLFFTKAMVGITVSAGRAFVPSKTRSTNSIDDFTHGHAPQTEKRRIFDWVRTLFLIRYSKRETSVRSRTMYNITYEQPFVFSVQ